MLHEIFGKIAYKKEGVFIAGGAGVTPFISIFRYLQANSLTGNNKLIFANKTQADIILKAEFQKLPGNNFINILSNEKINGYANGHITEKFITENCDIKNQLFYLCGPPPMIEAIELQLANLKVPDSSIIKEIF